MIRLYQHAFRLYFHHRFWKKGLIAWLLFTLIMGILWILAGTSIFHLLQAGISGILQQWEGTGLPDWLLTVVHVVAGLISLITAFLIIMLLYRSIAHLVLALLMERWLEYLDPAPESSSSIRVLFQTFLVSLRTALWLLGIEIAILVLLFLLNLFLPFLAPLWMVAGATFQMYLWGISLTDLVLSRDPRISWKTRRQFWKTHRSALIGLGALPYLTFFLPVVGWFLLLPVSLISAVLFIRNQRIHASVV